MKLVTVPYWLKKLFAGWMWEIPVINKTVFLTFDDGPTPEVTPTVLAFLLKYQAKATFFCLGKQVELFPELFHDIQTHGHQIGNHGYLHLNGFKINSNAHFKNMIDGKKMTKSRLYRPPYGHIWPWQAPKMKQEGVIVMWSLMSYDFDKTMSSEKCFLNLISSIKSGSIVVFHDTLKAMPNLVIVLPKLLEWLKKEGYQISVIPNF